MKKNRKPRFNSDGLPVDAKEWTEADWQDLHEAIEAVKRNIARRHQCQSQTTSEKKEKCRSSARIATGPGSPPATSEAERS